MSQFPRVKKLLIDTITSYTDSIPSSSAAALSYRSIFSLAPLLFIVIFILSIFVSQETAQQQIESLIGSLFDNNAAQIVQNLISIIEQHTQFDYTLGSLIGLLFLLYAASTLFRELKIALNSVWGLPSGSNKGPKAFVITQATAIAMVILIAFFFLLLLTFNIIVSLLDAHILPGEYLSLFWGSIFGSLLVTTVLIALIYKIVPDVTLPWSDLWIGSLVTAILMMVGLWCINFYLNFSNIGSLFGTAGAVLILLLWIYYTAQVFLFGASFAYAWSTNFGSKKAT
jgi:membrane protein